MNREQLVAYLIAKREEKQTHLVASCYMDQIKGSLPDRIFNHIQAVISSRVAACDISIRDHERDLEKIDSVAFAATPQH